MNTSLEDLVYCGETTEGFPIYMPKNQKVAARYYLDSADFTEKENDRQHHEPQTVFTKVANNLFSFIVLLMR